MAINYKQKLETALRQIGYLGIHYQLDTLSEKLVRNGKIITAIDPLSVILTHLDRYFDWCDETKFDWHEIQHPLEFLVEAKSNAGRYGKSPILYNLYLGKDGVVLSVKQSGSGFDAHKVNKVRIGRGKWGFKYFRECKETIFFDNTKNALEIFGLYLISDERVKA
jgi:hypothetical protein